MSATIDGVPWSAAAITVQYGPNVPAPFYIKAWDSTLQNPTTGRQIAFSTGVYRTGTFVACPAPSCDPGIFFDLTVNGTDWYAGPLPGGSGTLVISTMTAHNAVGSFSFTGVAQNGSTKPVISGTFNVTY